MSALRNLAEPAFIVTAFTAACLINRRRDGKHHHHVLIEDDLESGQHYTDESLRASPPLKPTIIHYERSQRRAPSLFFSLFSRFFNAYLFLTEIWYWNCTYWIYQLLRAFSARMIAGNEAIFNRAKDHAIGILHLEQWLGVAVEKDFQQFIMNQHAWLLPHLRNIYYSHISLGICFLIYIYTYLPAATFQRIRRTIAMNNAIAFVIVTTYRCYPPRLLPPEYGFVDILHAKMGGGNAWNNNRFQLTIAAMPSLHFGTALFLCICIMRFSPHRFLRIIAPLWPAAMIITIVATANHFLLDAFIGAQIPYWGWRYNRAVVILKPVQDWVFGPLIRRLDLVKPPSRSVTKALQP